MKLGDDRFDWLSKRALATPPQNDHICDFWILKGATDRDITCAAYRVATGIEVRVTYSADEIVATKLFRGVGADEQLAEAADAWRLALLAKGFRDGALSPY